MGKEGLWYKKKYQTSKLEKDVRGKKKGWAIIETKPKGSLKKFYFSDNEKIYSKQKELKGGNK